MSSGTMSARAAPIPLIGWRTRGGASSSRDSPLAARAAPRSIAGSILTTGGSFFARSPLSLTFATGDQRSAHTPLVSLYSGRRLFSGDHARRRFRGQQLGEHRFDIGPRPHLVLGDKDGDDRAQHFGVRLSGHRVHVENSPLEELALRDLHRNLGLVSQDLGGLIRILQNPGACPLIGL